MTTCKAKVSKVLRQGLIRKLHRTLAERPSQDSGLPGSQRTPGCRPSPGRAPTRPGAPNARPGRSEGCEEDATAPHVALGRDRGCQRALEAKRKNCAGEVLRHHHSYNRRGLQTKGERRERERTLLTADWLLEEHCSV